MSRFKNLIWLLVGCWLATASVSVAQADFEDGVAAYEQGDYDRAVWWFRKAAEQGDARAQNNLGLMYDNGHGVPEDYAEAATWYRRAAEQGHVDAQLNLGRMYYRGRGVPHDYVLAHMWFNLAATQGNEHAMYNRDMTVNRMTRGQLPEAQRLAREWKPKE